MSDGAALVNVTVVFCKAHVPRYQPRYDDADRRRVATSHVRTGFALPCTKKIICVFLVLLSPRICVGQQHDIPVLQLANQGAFQGPAPRLVVTVRDIRVANRRLRLMVLFESPPYVVAFTNVHSILGVEHVEHRVE